MTQIEVNILGEAGSNLPEMLKLLEREVMGTLRIFTGQLGDFWISIIPTLNVTAPAIHLKTNLANMGKTLEYLYHRIEKN